VRRGGADEWADAEAAALRALGQLRDEIERLDAVAEVGELGPARLPCVLLETVFRNLVANAVEAGPGKAGGAGLGLVLCREIIRRRGGDIWLELPATIAFRVGRAPGAANGLIGPS